jgi:hypothetical protein
MTAHKITQERGAATGSGGFLLVLALAGFLGAAALVVNAIATGDATGDEIAVLLNIGAAIAVSLVAVLILSGLYSLQQNESAAITLFGNYKGTDKKPGLRWVVPWYSRKKISLRVHNVTSETLKVNDKRGNPIEIAAVVEHEAGEVTPGTEPGAPSETVKFGTKLLIATAGSALITALVWLIIRLHILDFIVQTPGSN